MKSLQETVEELKKMAKEIRLDALEMALATGEKGAHLGGGLSSVEIITALYGSVLRYDAKNPNWKDRDRFLPSKNHCVLAHFPALVRAGFLKHDELADFAKDGSRLVGYPQNREIGLEYSGGSLGMAISVGIGMALSLKDRKSTAQVYVLMGDGELNEGSIWEAFMSAAHYKLNNLTAIIDRNHLCYDGDTENVMALGDLSAKLSSFGWNAISCNGHDIEEILKAFSNRAAGKPNVIIAETIKGKGVSFMENRREWHQSRISKEQYEIARKEIMGE